MCVSEYKMSAAEIHSTPTPFSTWFPSLDGTDNENRSYSTETYQVMIVALTLTMFGVVLCLVSVTAVLLYMVKKVHGLVGSLRADSSETCTGLLNGTTTKPPSSPKKKVLRRVRAQADTSCGISEVDEESDHRL